MSAFSSNKKRKITIHDIARQSGVSVGTVSRVLNKKATVNNQTRLHVQKIINETGYIPDSAARTLIQKNVFKVGAHIMRGRMHFSNYNMVMFQHLLSCVVNRGGQFFELPTRSNGLPVLNADALLLLDSHVGDPRIDYLESKSIPYVVFGHSIGTNWIGIDNYDGGKQVGRYFGHGGHTQLLHLAARLYLQVGEDRLTGFRDGLAEFGVELDDSRVITDVDTALYGYRSIIRYARQHPKEFESITGIFVYSDEIASGVMQGLADLNRKVPHDVSVVGFDNIPEVAQSLSTVHQDIPKHAETAIDMLYQQLIGKTVVNRVLPVQLVIRDSSASLNAGNS